MSISCCRISFLILTLSSVCSAQTKRPGAMPGEAQPALLASVAFSPDGSKIAAGGYKVVTLLDAGTGKILARLPNHAGTVTAVQFSPNGQILAAAGGLPGKQGEIRLWDAKTGKPVRTLQGHEDVIYGIAFSPDGTRLAAASYDHSVSLWTIEHRPQTTDHGPRTRRQGNANARAKIENRKSKIENPRPSTPLLLRDHTDAVYAVAFSRDGRLVASAAGDRTVKVWSAETGKRLYTFSESTAEVYTVAFSPDGKHLAAGGADKTLRTWNVSAKEGTPAKSAIAHDGAILRVAYSRDGQSIFTAGEDRAIKRWDAATLAEKRVFPKQRDWPQGIAVSPNDRLLAVARHDGSLALYDADSGRLIRQPLARALPAEPPANVPTSSAIPGRRLGDQKQRRSPGKSGAALFMASLGDISPKGAPRGGTVRFTLSGTQINDATGVFFDDPAITGKVVGPADKNANILRVDTTLGAQTRIGIHRVFVQTPHGATGAVTFAVGGWPEMPEKESNDTLDSAQSIQTPCTVVGAMDKPGDIDCYRFDARAGEELVFDVIAQPIRSRLQPVLTLVDSAGKTLAQSEFQTGRADALLGYRFAEAGSYVIQLRDYQNAGGGDVYYRLNVGEFPVVTGLFPLGLQRGTSTKVRVDGYNLDGAQSAAVQAPVETAWGRTTDVQMQTSAGSLLYSRRLAVGDDPEVLPTPGNDSVEKAQPVNVPVTINARLWSGKGIDDGRQTTDDRLDKTNAEKAQDRKSKIENRKFAALNPQPSTSNYFRFAGKKGQTLILEVQARRLGSPLDSEIEVLDARGNPVERAVLRAVAQTEVTLSDRDSASPGIRLLLIPDLQMNDYVLVGRELIQIYAMPKGPDDDYGFRSYRGQRLGFLGTTPEFHSVGATVYKVEVHPPGTALSPNGMPVTHLFYKNDDGGPLYGKDSYLRFTAPADGNYVVRIGDARGQQGENYAYRLLIHEPRPDFRVVMSPEHPNLPKGGSVAITVECERYDGFDGPIDVRMDGLPAGFTATASTIEAGETNTTLLLSAAPEAATPNLSRPSPIRVEATARIGGKEITRTIEPDNGVRLVTVMPDPDIRLATDRQEVVLRPGEETTVETEVDRRGDFGGRIPLDIRNLPYGVKVMNIGLNGVLVTEQENARSFTLYCEPWVQPQTRPFYVIGNVEGGVSNGAPPLLLRVEPAGLTRKRITGK